MAPRGESAYNRKFDEILLDKGTSKMRSVEMYKSENELKRLKSKSERMDFYAFLCAGAAGGSGSMAYNSLCFNTLSFPDIATVILGGIGLVLGLTGCYNLLEKEKQIDKKVRDLEDDMLKEEFPLLFR